MGRFQNNPSIGWLHPKFTHAHPLTWTNKELTRKPITLSIQPTFDSLTPIPVQKVFPHASIGQNQQIMKRYMLICLFNPCRWVAKRSKVTRLRIPYEMISQLQVDEHNIGIHFQILETYSNIHQKLITISKENQGPYNFGLNWNQFKVGCM